MASTEVKSSLAHSRQTLSQDKGRPAFNQSISSEKQAMKPTRHEALAARILVRPCR